VTETTTCSTGSALRLTMVAAPAPMRRHHGGVDGLLRLGGMAALAFDT
jgi:hypothetical protein